MSFNFKVSITLPKTLDEINQIIKEAMFESAGSPDIQFGHQNRAFVISKEEFNLWLEDNLPPLLPASLKSDRTKFQTLYSKLYGNEGVSLERSKQIDDLFKRTYQPLNIESKQTSEAASIPLTEAASSNSMAIDPSDIDRYTAILDALGDYETFQKKVEVVQETKREEGKNISLQQAIMLASRCCSILNIYEIDAFIQTLSRKHPHSNEIKDMVMMSLDFRNLKTLSIYSPSINSSNLIYLKKILHTSTHLSHLNFLNEIEDEDKLFRKVDGDSEFFDRSCVPNELFDNFIQFLSTITPTSLQSLRLMDAVIDKTQLPVIFRAFPDLKALIFKQSCIPIPADVFDLILENTKLESVELQDSNVKTIKSFKSQITDESVKMLAKKSPQLRKIVLICCTNIEGKNFDKMATLNTLEELTISHMRISTKALFSWLTKSPQLRKLSLLHCSNSLVANLEEIPHLTNLVDLNFRSSYIAEKGFTNLFQRWPHIRMLVLEDCPRITDQSLKDISSLTQLEHLDLTSTRVTEQGIKDLHQKRPNIKVIKKL